jgi:hypothetical protein
MLLRSGEYEECFLSASWGFQADTVVLSEYLRKAGKASPVAPHQTVCTRFRHSLFYQSSQASPFLINAFEISVCKESHMFTSGGIWTYWIILRTPEFTYGYLHGSIPAFVTHDTLWDLRNRTRAFCFTLFPSKREPYIKFKYGFWGIGHIRMVV